MYKMTPSVHEGMIPPHDENVVPHYFLPDMMGRGGGGPVEREPATISQKRPTPAPVEAVREVKKLKSKSLQYVCNVSSCGEKFISNKELDTHLKLHLGVKPFTCDLCGKVCQTENKLKAHQSSHANDGVKPVCDVCDRSFSSRSSLNKHKKMLHKPKPHICPQCNSGFEEHKYMVVHAKRAHDLELPLEHESDSRVSCTIDFSGNEFATNESSDISKELFKESCSSSVDNLSPPVNVVPNDNHILQKKSTLSTIAETSIVNREVDVPFNNCSSINCTLCTSTFPSVAYLEQHMAVHVDEKMLSCQSCALNFSNHEDLANHMRLHTTGNGSNFSPLFMHTGTRVTHVSNKYSCVVCKEHFVNLGSLKRHQAKGHSTTVLSI